MSCINANKRSTSVKKPTLLFNKISVVALVKPNTKLLLEQTSCAIPTKELCNPISNFIRQPVYCKKINSLLESSTFSNSALFFNSNSSIVY